MESVDLNALERNNIRISVKDSFGRSIHEQRLTNWYTFAAAGVFMNGILRSGPSQVTHLYGRFGDSGANPGHLAPKNSDQRYTTRNDFIKSNNNVHGGFWVPLLATPSQTTSDRSLYDGNEAHFFFRIPGDLDDSQIDPADNWDPSTSYVYELGLAVAMNIHDRSQDVIIAVMDNVKKFQVPSGSQMTIDYKLQLETNKQS